jgi:hypothetical protein
MSIYLVMYRVCRTGVLGEAALLTILVGVLLIAVTRGCSRGDDELGSGVGIYGVAGGRENGGGKIGGRAIAGRAVGVGVAGCACSSGIASRARVWAGWGVGWAYRARGVGVAGSAAASRASEKLVVVGVSRLPRRREARAESPRHESTDETLGLWRSPRLLRVVRGVGA